MALSKKAGFFHFFLFSCNLTMTRKKDTILHNSFFGYLSDDKTFVKEHSNTVVAHIIIFAMDNAECIKKFEFLPNEILIECFEYLNACDLFHSFDGLNDRFDHLIRHTRLYINFENANISIFDAFCRKMLHNSEMKKQVYSLYFPADRNGLLTKVFFSIFSPVEFPDLQKYGAILPRESPLDYSDMSTSYTISMVEPTGIFLSRLRTLSIVRPCCFIDTSLSILNLTVNRCDLEGFCQLLNYLPNLKYFHIQHTDDRATYVQRDID